MLALSLANGLIVQLQDATRNISNHRSRLLFILLIKYAKSSETVRTKT